MVKRPFGQFGEMEKFGNPPRPEIFFIILGRVKR